LNSPDIVVVIATKNRPLLLEKRAIQSVINQTLLPSGVVIVDDSEDVHRSQNRAIVERIQLPECPAFYLKNERTSGASGAWNTAIDFISEKWSTNDNVYVAILDDDDEWLEDYLKCCSEFSKQHDLDFVASDFYRIESSEQTHTRIHAPERIQQDLFLRGNPGIQGSNLFMRLSTFLMAGGFDEALESCTDRDLCIRICDLGFVKYARLNQPLMRHYAEINRQRLSTPRSESKSNGLSAFWLKYKSRMTRDQKDAFCERARTLFDWRSPQAEYEQEIPPCRDINRVTSKLESCNHDVRVKTAKQHVEKLFQVSDLLLLGTGFEAVVLTDHQWVYKCIDNWNERFSEYHLKFLNSQIGKWNNLKGLCNIEQIHIQNSWMLLIYKFEPTQHYNGSYEGGIIDLLRSCSRAGIVCNNLHPKNLVVSNNEVKLIDYGFDIKPWNELGFEHMARRAFLCIHYANHPDLNQLMQTALFDLSLVELTEYGKFRNKLIGHDRDICREHFSISNSILPSSNGISFNLYIGIISDDPDKLKPLMNSLSLITQSNQVENVIVTVLCNGCSDDEIKQNYLDTPLVRGAIHVIDEAQQKFDAENGVFGQRLSKRPAGQVGIAQARSMVQKYVGQFAEKDEKAIAWILDDDMRLDTRVIQYLSWLPIFKQNNVDILIGSYEGSSPNPPINGLRVHLVDLLHNLIWLQKLPENSMLPDRSAENIEQRKLYSDYYYDLSRKHCAHQEFPHWLEPIFEGETVREAYARLLHFAPMIVTGYPLTRSIKPTGSLQDPVKSARPSVNRGGNTFIFNSKALTETPNLIPIIKGREARRSDMIWAIVNKHYKKMTILATGFPVLHDGRVTHLKPLSLNKVQDEIIGSALYAAFGEFLMLHPAHSMDFSEDEVLDIWRLTIKHRDQRLHKLKQSFLRIYGLTQSISSVVKGNSLGELIDYLLRSFTLNTFDEIKFGVQTMDQSIVFDFVQNIRASTDDFAESNNIRANFMQAGS
jgi:glycosyltransferase involved in cell wall biosynthesis